jgi:hypothetical protein
MRITYIYARNFVPKAEQNRTFGNQCLGSMDIQKQYLVKLNFQDVIYGYMGFSGGINVL